ncbi:MAG: hypothetical protein ACXVAF_05705 [Vulcanimicrobiaceae bacterium]
MVRGNLTRWRWLLAIVLVGAAAPGSTVQNVPLHMDGSANGTWRVTASRVLKDTVGGRTDYQWYLSVYSPDGALAYRSPGDTAGLVTRLQKANGAPYYFPHQSLSIAGAGRLMGSDAEQAVVAIREIGADCGAMTVAILDISDGGRKAVPVARVTNFCDLEPKIVGDAVQLTGPYYGPSAPLCCPTKNHASAMLRYRNGEWVESPLYFRLHH